ncbi:hypothetical protein [Caldanaerobacter subterraneus]|jgi:hypothetical protein|uniref:Uncharacterized protein n=1 Tax=Caldanaerobacter subterraneus TaxID=911092 RepID=A0A4R2JV01_9THEO|nr:hypothetical protein [Caldanaerobacter subterraneus]TCO64223.1 hypothetical protein EV203_11265 [Caldanaerobacter subterraneus]
MKKKSMNIFLVFVISISLLYLSSDAIKPWGEENLIRWYFVMLGR